MSEPIKRPGSRFHRSYDTNRSADVAWWRLICVLADDRARTRPRKESPPVVRFSVTTNPLDWSVNYEWFNEFRKTRHSPSRQVGMP